MHVGWTHTVRHPTITNVDHVALKKIIKKASMTIADIGEVINWVKVGTQNI